MGSLLNEFHEFNLPDEERTAEERRKEVYANCVSVSARSLMRDEDKARYATRGKAYEKVCKVCGTPFTAWKSYAFYCSDACREAARREKERKRRLSVKRKAYEEGRKGE